MLGGLVFDADGGRLTPTHAKKGTRRYRYYVSGHLVTGAKPKGAGGLRLPAGELDALVVQALHDLIAAPATLLDALGPVIDDAPRQHELLATANRLAQDWQQLSHVKVRVIVQIAIARADVHRDHIRLHVAVERLADVLLGKIDDPQPAKQAQAPSCCYTIDIPAMLRRAGQEMRLVVDGDPSRPRAAPKLVRLVRQGIQFRDELLAANNLGVAELAANTGMSSSHYTRVLRLGFLAQTS